MDKAVIQSLGNHALRYAGKEMSQLTVEAQGFSKTMDSEQGCTKRVSKPRRNEFQMSKEVCVLTVNC